jgi:anti-sigma regulatory factor (Ser/Thr protein kinase)
VFSVIDASFERELASGVNTPGVARRLLTERFAALLTDGMLTTARLLVSELVTNAVTHGVGRITLKAQVSERRPLVAVLDEGGGFDRELRARNLHPTEVGGWGLSIVDAKSSRWGVDRDRSHVWFELERSAPPLESHVTRSDNLCANTKRTGMGGRKPFRLRRASRRRLRPSRSRTRSCRHNLHLRARAHRRTRRNDMGLTA